MTRKDGKNYLIRMRCHNIYLWAAQGRMILGSSRRPTVDSENGLFKFDEAVNMINAMSGPKKFEKFKIEFIEEGHPEVSFDGFGSIKSFK